jgi:hypothetical protein
VRQRHAWLDIRMIKLQTKTNGGWRTLNGARHRLTIRAYISCTIKNRLNTLQALHGAITGNPWLPTTTTT